MKKNEKVTIFFLQPFLVNYLNYELGRSGNLACDVNIPPVLGHGHLLFPVVDNVDVYICMCQNQAYELQLHFATITATLRDVGLVI